MPRSVTSTKSLSSVRRRAASLAASSGSPPSTISKPAAPKWRASTSRTSCSSSTSRMVRAARGSSAAGASATERRRPEASRRVNARLGGGRGRRWGRWRGRFGRLLGRLRARQLRKRTRVRRVARDRRLVELLGRWRRRGRCLGSRRRRGERCAHGVGRHHGRDERSQLRGDHALGGRRERCLHGRRRLGAVVVHPLRQREQHLLRIDAADERLQADVALADGLGNRVGQLESEGTLAQPRELVQREAEPAPDGRVPGPGRERRQTRVGCRRVRRERGDQEPLAEHDRSVAALHPHVEVAGLLAEGDDLDDVEERQILQVALQSQRVFQSPGRTIPRPGSRRRCGRAAGCARSRPPRSPPWASRK